MTPMDLQGFVLSYGEIIHSALGSRISIVQMPDGKVAVGISP
jgi:hypothetical protein